MRKSWLFPILSIVNGALVVGAAFSATEETRLLFAVLVSGASYWAGLREEPTR